MTFGSSHGRCSVIKAVLKNFAIFTGNTCVGVFFDKITIDAIIKKKLQQKCFIVNITKFSRTRNSKNISKWLLLETQTFGN